ncbi:hypothetical protein BDV93DRAFT_547062 [Ceratobasidium sp. AG-I]|nr:hypothetical protein BDV93DRAFT_547062 [Ceratobasidium sp. AG-I]
MGELDATFGATYIGVVIATFFYGILTLQVYIYWVKYVHDSTFDRLFVVALWLVDTIQLVCICQMQYHYTIDNYANPAALAEVYWSISLEVGLTAVITFMVQAFFAARAWFFTKRVGSRFTTTRRTQMLGAVIALISFVQLGFGLASFAMTIVLKQFEKFIDYKWLVGGWLGSAAACDILIVYMLSTALMTQKTGFGRTDALIGKLLRHTINTGLLTSIIAVIDLIAFCTMNNFIHFCFNFMLGKLYSNTLLATLNARDINPTNVVHVESSSYKLGDVPRGAVSAVKFNRSEGELATQDRGEPGIHLHTDTAVEVSATDVQRRMPKKVVLVQESNESYHGGKESEVDLDGADSVDSERRTRV